MNILKWFKKLFGIEERELTPKEIKKTQEVLNKDLKKLFADEKLTPKIFKDFKNELDELHVELKETMKTKEFKEWRKQFDKESDEELIKYLKKHPKLLSSFLFTSRDNS